MYGLSSSIEVVVVRLCCCWLDNRVTMARIFMGPGLTYRHHVQWLIQHTIWSCLNANSLRTQNWTEIRWNFTTMLEDHAFMDDLGQLSSTMNHLQSKKTELEDNLAKVGLKLNTKKCKDQKGAAWARKVWRWEIAKQKKWTAARSLASVTKDGGRTAYIRKTITWPKNPLGGYTTSGKPWICVERLPIREPGFFHIVLWMWDLEVIMTDEKRIYTFTTKYLKTILKIRW